jgi:hypothetical protein
MHLFYLLFLILIISSPLSAPAQAGKEDEELMAWSAAGKPGWADYKGTPDAGSGAAASTATYLGFEYSISNNGFSYKITSYFSKTKSWGIVKTDYILSHEHGHFDIAEIFARKLHQKMKAYRFNKNTFREDLDKIYNGILDEKEKMQNQYDNETDYSRHKTKQAEWLKKIDKMLAELKEFSDY